MASVEKFAQSAVVNQLRHNNREIQYNSNVDIDSERTSMNYSLTPRRNIREYDYYKRRLSELYQYGRDDVKTMAGWVVTLPKEIERPEEQRAFFKAVYDFLEKRYGKENVVQANVHYDEGKTEKIRNRFTDEVEYDASGKPMMRLVHGQPHLHFCFIPAAKIDHDKLHRKKKYPKKMDAYREKVSANDVLNKRELQHFHTDLQKYLDEHGINGKVINGRTKAQGRNYTVKEMKENFELQQELRRLRDIERKYNVEHDVKREGRW